MEDKKQKIIEFFNTPEIPIVKLQNNFRTNHDIKIFVKREDLIHAEVSGNKWHKLKYNLIAAINDDHKNLLTFGGAFSNHIYAVAAAGKYFGFKTIGIIRGEKVSNPTLDFAKEKGMILHFIDRKTYRDKYNPKLLSSLKNKFGNFYLIPEGGSNELAVKGCAEIINSTYLDYDYICVPCGTGGTLAGIISGLDGRSKALGFAVLKGADFLVNDVKILLDKSVGKQFNNWEINLNYHFGGYAKINAKLIEFIKNFEDKHKIPLEPVYSGKMFYGIYDLINKNYFPKKTKILAIHTGGLQGLAGMRTKIEKLI